MQCSLLREVTFCCTLWRRYLSFVKGIVDSDTLPLSVSRESLQAHASLKVIKKKVVRKVLDTLKRLADAEKEVEAGARGAPLQRHHPLLAATLSLQPMPHIAEPVATAVLLIACCGAEQHV